MKLHLYLAASLVFSSVFGFAESKRVNLSVAALSLPASSTGELHWSCGDDYITQPVQLSKRYFSKSIELKSDVVRFFEEPIEELLPDVPLPQPVLTVAITPGIKEAFVVVLGRDDDDAGKQTWQSLTIDGDDWKAGTLRVVNVNQEEVGMIYPGNKLKLKPGKHVEFVDEDWKEPFPMKIVQLEPVAKLVFSSTWRVSQGRREICFLSKEGGSVRLRSLLVLN